MQTIRFSSCEITAITKYERGNVIEYQGSIRDITELENARRALETQAITDGLTGLYNQKHFHERLKNEVSRAHRYHAALSLVLMDIDYFKNYNDTYGHNAGDEVIKALGNQLLDGRGSDISFRIGGDEFAVLLPDTELRDATIAANRIRDRFKATAFEPIEEEYIYKTLSIGVAQYDWKSDHEKFFVQTDNKLYESKDAGRDRISS